MNKIIPIFIAAWLLSAACNRKLARAEVKDHLEKAMADHLQQRQPKDAPHPKFNVLDVEWFEEVSYYICEFKIKMILPDGKDTTGIMKQKVSKDFSKVE